MFTYVGLAVWLAVSGLILWYFFISRKIDNAQRRAWEEFGKRYKLGIVPGEEKSDPISLSGMLNGRQIEIYTMLELDEAERMRSVHTHIEVYLNEAPQVGFVISKNPLPLSMSDISFDEIYSSTDALWPMPAISLTESRDALAPWMTSMRIKALKDFMAMAEKGTDVMLMGDGSIAFMLLRTDNPLMDPKDLNATVQKLYAIARAFESGTSANPNAPSESAPAETPI